MRKEFGYEDESVQPVGELDPSIGLCVNCKHSTACTFCGSSDNPKQFCEEYECMGASCSEIEPDIVVVSSEPVTTSEVVTSEQNGCTYLGLCVNCDNRESCCHTAHAGGIWYCEEYC